MWIFGALVSLEQEQYTSKGAKDNLTQGSSLLMKNKNISRSAIILLGLVASFSIASRADSVIFNDFGTCHSYNSSMGLTIAGTRSIPGFIEWGEAFTPNARFDLTKITMALGWVTGMNGVTVSLDTNNGGAPGTPLASWSFLGLPQFGSTNSIVQTMTFANGTVLQPGQKYWLVTAPFAANTQAVWNLNSTGVIGLGAVNFGNVWLTTTGPSGAFEVLGKSVVPEPSNWLLFGAGLLGILGAVRKENGTLGHAQREAPMELAGIPNRNRLDILISLTVQARWGKRFQNISHDSAPNPLLKSAMASLVRRIALRNIPPGSTCPQHPQNTIQHGTPVLPRPAASISAVRWLRNKCVQGFPLLVSQVKCTVHSYIDAV